MDRVEVEPAKCLEDRFGPHVRFEYRAVMISEIPVTALGQKLKNPQALNLLQLGRDLVFELFLRCFKVGTGLAGLCVDRHLRTFGSGALLAVVFRSRLARRLGAFFSLRRKLLETLFELPV